jgi:hypothetical protein
MRTHKICSILYLYTAASCKAIVLTDNYQYPYKRNNRSFKIKYNAPKKTYEYQRPPSR